MSTNNQKRARFKSFTRKEVLEGLGIHFEDQYDETDEQVRDFFLKGWLPSYKTSYEILKKFLK